MEHGPQSQPHRTERQEPLEQEIKIPLEISWPFQMKIFVGNFLDKDGKKIKDLDNLNDEQVDWWAENYGKAFRDFCESHPHVAKQILSGNVDAEDVSDMVSYIKNNRSTAKEIQAERNSLQKYIVH